MGRSLRGRYGIEDRRQKIMTRKTLIIPNEFEELKRRAKRLVLDHLPCFYIVHRAMPCHAMQFNSQLHDPSPIISMQFPIPSHNKKKTNHPTNPSNGVTLLPAPGYTDGITLPVDGVTTVPVGLAGAVYGAVALVLLAGAPVATGTLLVCVFMHPHSGSNTVM